jgi:inhibitor of cysteine peptidase
MDQMKNSSGLVLLGVFLTACTAQVSGIALTASNNGMTIEASQNQAISIKLDSNVTTGFKWNLVTEPDANMLKFVSSEYVAPNTTLVGAGGYELWKFQATGKGTTALKLAYFRPFDPKDVAKEFTVTIVVK